MVCTVPMMEALVIWSMHGRDNLDSLVITSNPFSGWLSGVSPLSFLLSVGTCGFKGILSAEGAVAVCSRMCRKKSFQNLISWIFKQNVRVVGPQGPGSKTQHTFWFDLTPPQPWSHWSLLSFSQARFQSQTLNPYASASEYAFVMLMMPTSHVEVLPDFHKSNTGSFTCLEFNALLGSHIHGVFTRLCNLFWLSYITVSTWIWQEGLVSVPELWFNKQSVCMACTHSFALICAVFMKGQ
jgi:hypothetical protein